MLGTIDDLFPPSDRVFYKKAPLVQVSAQVRFPRLLTIESAPPAAFQERVRGTFPLFERGNPLSGLGQLPGDVLQMLNAQMGGAQYQFLTVDRDWTITLAPDSLTLQTLAYSTWQVFRDHFANLIEALGEIYAPSFYSRVGLQYVDAINRETLGLADRSWSSLLRSEFFGGFGIPGFEDNIEGMSHVVQLRLPDDAGKVIARAGFGTVIGKPGASYILDFDLFKEGRVEVSHVWPILDAYNALAGRAFRWCILDPLRDALDPQPDVVVDRDEFAVAGVRAG